MTETNFDVINIEYQYESDFDEMNPSDSLLNWDADVTVSVNVPDWFKDKHFSFTEDRIREHLETHISQRLEEPVVVVDFTAFYAGTKDPLRGNYEDFQAEQKKLHPGLYRYKGKIGLRKGWTECQTCDDLVKLNDINWYYLKGYGQATVCDSCVGKYNYKKDRLSKGGRHGELAILQFMEQDRKEAETFEAKQIGSIRIAKNPNFPSGTSLQAYIKTNRGELRKVFGNPNMGESGDGKSKGKEWNLIVGPHRVTIYDRREKDKKGTKYFNIGGDGKYGALLVAQALSLHRNERVYAKETVPQWLEDERRYQQVKSIDEHPDLTYHRAKEYENNRRRYRAETFEDEDLRKQFMEVAYDEILENVPHEVAWESGGHLHIYETYDELVNGISSGEITPQMMIDCIKQLGAETFAVDVIHRKDGIEVGDNSMANEYQCGECDSVYDDSSDATICCKCPSCDEPIHEGDCIKYAEDDLTFKEWADQEMKTHGGRESFDDWLDDELESHGDNVSLQDWGHHELDSHYERYGAESFEDFKRKMVGDNFIAGDVGYMEALEDFYAEYLEEFEEITDEFCPKPETFEEFQERVLKNDYEMSLEAENWGGDPKGQLATALRNARIKAKQPKKPLKIEKLDAETDDYVWVLKETNRHGTEATLHKTKQGITRFLDEYDGNVEDLTEGDWGWSGYFGNDSFHISCTKQKVMDAETSGQWEIGEQLEEAQMNAEGSGRIDHEGGRMVAIDEVIVVDYTWRTDPDDANVDEWRVHDEVEEKVESEMHIGDSSYGTFYTYDNDNNESVEVSYSWDKSIEDGGEEIIKSWAETDESLHAEGKKRKKRSGVLSDPFDELSLDSGDWKGIVIGFGVGLLGLFGYSKLRK